MGKTNYSRFVFFVGLLRDHLFDSPIQGNQNHIPCLSDYQIIGFTFNANEAKTLKNRRFTGTTAAHEWVKNNTIGQLSDKSIDNTGEY